jgi:hypothetical protein
MDSPGVHCGYLGEYFQLGSNNLQAIEHQCIAGSDAERRRSSHFSHGLVSAKCNLCEECLRLYEFELARCITASSCLLQHPVGEQVQNIL